MHHQRKGGGEDGEAVSGSNATTGAMDYVVELQRPKDMEEGARKRVLLSLSRWAGTPGTLLVDHNHQQGWCALSEAEGRHADGGPDNRKQQARAWLLDELRVRSLTYKSIEETKGHPNRRYYKPALEELEAEGIADKRGEKGDPYTWHLLNDPDSTP